MKLSENVKEKLAEVIELWADDILVGKPAILANAVFINMEKALIAEGTKINETFKS